MTNILQEKNSLSKKYNFIYLTTNTVNVKQYIGQHRTDNLNDYYLGSGLLLLCSIKKYRKENFTFEILHYCYSQDELNLMEDRYIIWYETTYPKGYNLRSGGIQCSVHNEATKEKIREARKRQVIIHSEETKRKMSESHKNIPLSPHHYAAILKNNQSEHFRKNLSEKRKGMKFTEQHCKNISIAKSNPSNETRQKISQSQKGKKLSAETIEKMKGREPHNKNRVTYYHIITNELIFLNANDPIPKNYKKGLGNKKSSEIRDDKFRQQVSERHKNTSYYYNKELDKEIKLFSDDVIPDGFIKGRRPVSQETKNKLKKKVWIHNPTTGEKRMINNDEEIPDGFIKGRGPYNK
jgi:hypothetical protein